MPGPSTYLLPVSLFILGLTGSLWTTVYAFLLHQYERWEFLDTLIDEAVYEVVGRLTACLPAAAAGSRGRMAVPEYVLPLLLRKLRAWDPPPPPPAAAAVSTAAGDEPCSSLHATYLGLRLDALLLEADELEMFHEHSMRVVQMRRLWHREAYVTRRVWEACNQYPWRLIPSCESSVEESQNGR